MSEGSFQIITFYQFKDLGALGNLSEVRDKLRYSMRAKEIKGTILLADEGYNATVCGRPESIKAFLFEAESILEERISYKSSLHFEMPFRKVDVKIKPEIVTLKRNVDISLSKGTHISAADWNSLISDPDVILLDTRNNYEYKTGTFPNAINPNIAKFSDLPGYVAENLSQAKGKKIAMFCTGGIRCEKFAPYLKGLGFENVFQLEGGILRYLETVPKNDQLWNGECFVFDGRITLDAELRKGHGPDLSQPENINE